MPSMISSLVQGFKNFKSIVKYETTHNIVSESMDHAKMHGTSQAKAAAKAVGMGALTFLAPPVVIGQQAVKDYKQKQFAESQHDKLQSLTNCLQSHGISAPGASEMAHLIVMGTSNGYYINDTDFKMWMLVASIKEPHLAQYTSRIADRLLSNKTKLNLS